MGTYYIGMELSQRLDLGAIEVEESQDTYERLRELVEGVTGGVVKRDAPLEISSLDRIELAVRIEELFGVRIDEETYGSHRTAAELAAFVESQQ